MIWTALLTICIVGIAHADAPMHGKDGTAPATVAGYPTASYLASVNLFGTAEADEVRVDDDLAPSDIRLEVAGGLATGDTNETCRLISFNAAACSTVDAPGLTLDLNAGSDRVSLSSSQAGSSVIDGGSGNDRVVVESAETQDYVVLYGGTGADALIGSETLGEGDALYGDSGNDVIKGRAGKDAIFGDSGSDDVFGGRGDDRLVLAERRRPARDGVIDCGAGRDHALIDRKDPAPAHSCEDVIRLTRGAP